MAILREEFGTVVQDEQAAERRNTLAILKILEFIVSGQIRQRPGEDYFLTICRLIVHGLSDEQASATTRRALDKALAEIKEGNRWTTTSADLVQMRGWRGKRVITRAILLLVIMANLISPVELMAWLQRPNPNLGNHAPVDLMRADRWRMLADFVDDLLTGSPA